MAAADLTFDMFGLPDTSTNQFKLVRIQTYNWGTFSGVFDFAIPEQGYLFVGPSGSGKSTILDAHAALTTPPKWVDFNVAAREADRQSKDRNILTYIRGAWAQQTGDTGEYVSQYLRPDTTWTAIAETYRDATGKVVVLAEVLWVRGKTTAASEARKLYLVLQREFDVRELQFFPDCDFRVQRFKQDLPDAAVFQEFSAYQERFRGLLGIDNERALRLLHKTQSAKNLGDLNTFLRDFMLDSPATFDLADKLVAQFHELNDAHRAVVEARRHFEVLTPARAQATLLETARAQRSELNELSVGIDAYREQVKKTLLEQAVAQLDAQLGGMHVELQRLADVADAELLELSNRQAERAGLGGNLIEQLAHQLRQATDARAGRMARRDLAAEAFAAMDWPTPADPIVFAHTKEQAKRFMLDADNSGRVRDEERLKLHTRIIEKTKEFEAARREINAMEKRRSNIPANMQVVRENLARALNIPEEKLSFAGELIEVKPEEAEWQGAIERVLGGFAQALLVDDKQYAAVSAYLNEHSTGERLVYLRITDQLPVGRHLGPDSLVHKLNFAQHSHANWLRNELKALYDYECAPSMTAFRRASRAVTKEGQVKHNETRHEKNDRQPVGNRSRWVLGFDNAAKLKLFKDEAFKLAEELAELQGQAEKMQAAKQAQQSQLLHCQTLVNLTWDEIDVAGLLAEITRLQTQLEAERAARPDLATLDQRIREQQKVHAAAMSARTAYEVLVLDEEKTRRDLSSRIVALSEELISLTLTPFQQSELMRRYQEVDVPTHWSMVDQSTRLVERRLRDELDKLNADISTYVRTVETRFADFIREWPAEAGGLDATMASAPDFFAKLTRLELDGLPQHEKRFLELLHEQSDQNLSRLSMQIEQERKGIRDRMALVNESLETAPFNPGTHLVIETHDKMLEDVRQFTQSLKESLSYAFSSASDVAERRFEVLRELVRRFSSQDTPDRNWRELVLDVRQHVEFVARELDDSGLEVEVYRSGAGKSGGQRQKLAATILAAALRYQLGGQDRALPTYSTVVLDEAFDKADSEFTAIAMNIFKTFGFQMIVATPLKSVMTLEPFIGGACFVHIKDRKNSAVIAIDYDTEAQRLKLSPALRDDDETVPA